MKVLHVYPKSDSLIERHVTLLAEGMRQSADVKVADSAAAFRKLFREMAPDIVHCHGCWQFFLARAASYAIRHEARVVLTPHGQLEPWVIKRQSVQENISKTLLWQRRTVERAYAVILLGKLEYSNFKQLGWNLRTEEIHNAVITNAITQAEMCTQTFAVYQKVMDSNTLEQMDDDSLHALAQIIKAGIMGDRRWVKDLNIDETRIDWRRLLIYAEHENISNYVDYGISILGLSTPSIDVGRIASYFPDHYQRPKPLKEVVGDYQGDETDYLVRIFRQINKHPLLLHLIELTRELYRDNVNDDLLSEKLEGKNLHTYAARLMQVLSEQTLLDEGYMPIDPQDDRQTEQIRKTLTNHLKI
jgi:hypothetical protein